MAERFFNVSLNLPHAARIAGRLVYHLKRVGELQKCDLAAAVTLAEELETKLEPYLFTDENPDPAIGTPLAAECAEVARRMVDTIEKRNAGDDRLGQAVRNFFECLELGREGARQSLRAGENPDSTLRA